jgi:hypothetical protein
VSDAVASLRTVLPDVIHQRGDDEYADAASPDNSCFLQRPFAVARPRSADEVATIVRCAGQLGVKVAVQATGHGAGAPIGDDSLLLDTSALRGVTVDRFAATARVAAGERWPAVQEAGLPFDLLGLSGTSPTVGVVGYTFGGGVGWFVRKYGLASAALRSVDYVDGAGHLRTASPDAKDPLDRAALWAFRGGAPVGIATSIEIDLFRVPELWTGYLLWPANAAGAVVEAWASAVEAVSPSVTSSISLRMMPPDGPFPGELRGRPAVHLSYTSTDGGDQLDAMRSAVRYAVEPTVDTTGRGDLQSLSAIHLDPPTAVPARGMGRWLSEDALAVVGDLFEAARIGEPGGLQMIEVRHTDSPAGPDGAFTSVPAPFLVHAVGLGSDDDVRSRTDGVLSEVASAGRHADIGRAVPAFRDGQPDSGDAWSAVELADLRNVRGALDPERVLGFQKHPAF